MRELFILKYSNSVFWRRELGWAMRAMGMNPTENELLELINEVSHLLY
jgi:hypothetical protein